MSDRLNKMAEYGISWCDSGETKKGEQTSICGNCTNFAPKNCECISDECADLDEKEVENFGGFNN